MHIRPIKTEADFETALTLIDQLWDAEYGTAEYDSFETLAVCIENYEREKGSADFADPIEAIRYHMEQKEKSFEDLATLFESSDLAFQILYKEKSLTLPMAWKLCQAWGIPAESLIKPYKVKENPECELSYLAPAVGHS